MELQKIKCPYCGSLELVQNADGTYKCNDCGQIVKPDLKGQTANIASGAVSYGANAVKELADENSSRRVVAGVLAILLGVFGAQHFFLGKYKKGFMCLLLDLVPVIGWTINEIMGIVQGIQFLLMSNKDFNSKY